MTLGFLGKVVTGHRVQDRNTRTSCADIKALMSKRDVLVDAGGRDCPDR